MKVMDEKTKFAHLGKPGSAFSAGFARRLNMITDRIDLKDKKILDAGCGKGVWLEQFAMIAGAENVFGSDIDDAEFESVPEVIPRENLVKCPIEELDFPDNIFDVVFSHEVIEHVVDDKKAMSEMIRVLKPGGKLVLFCPNRGWPFEQHGMFFRGKYYWGNIPLLPWMPEFVHNKFAPHVRNYFGWELRRLWKDLPVEVDFYSHVFSGLDGFARRFGAVGRMVRSFIHLLERTPLRWFGISHFVILRKRAG